MKGSSTPRGRDLKTNAGRQARLLEEAPAQWLSCLPKTRKIKIHICSPSQANEGWQLVPPHPQEVTWPLSYQLLWERALSPRRSAPFWFRAGKMSKLWKSSRSPESHLLASLHINRQYRALSCGGFLTQNLRSISTLGYQQGEHKFRRKTLEKTVFPTSATLDKQTEL